ncbi:Integrity of mtDNA protein 2 [Cladobotryum mycophilum]|uniref:Large ribosomal subunit protein mL49 n=1 Tax=Cladobotryum mycophilum TaxID=491253 RepID=A0ABR0STU7_9HYPO
MSYLIPRTLRLRSQGLLQATLQSESRQNLLRNSLLPTTQAAFISVKPSPATPRHRRTAKDKIPATVRALSRPPTPLPTKTDEELASLSYIIRRTPSLELPVYRNWKSGGTRQVILVKKIDGDRRKLLEDFVEGLGVSRDDIRINPTTQHIELKGDYFGKTRDWILERGF